MLLFSEAQSGRSKKRHNTFMAFGPNLEAYLLPDVNVKSFLKTLKKVIMPYTIKLFTKFYFSARYFSLMYVVDDSFNRVFED